MNSDFERGWTHGVADAREPIPLHDPMRMRVDAKSGGRHYVHSSDYRDGYNQGYQAERGAQRIGPLDSYGTEESIEVAV